MYRGVEREFVPKKAQSKQTKEPPKLTRANFENAVRAFLKTPALKSNETEAEIRRSGDGLYLSLRLTAADYGTRLHSCEFHASGAVKGSGIDFTPSDEFIGVCFNLDEKHPLLGLVVNHLLGFDDPRIVRRSKTILVLNNISKAEIGGLVTIPKNTIFKTKRTRHSKLNGA